MPNCEMRLVHAIYPYTFLERVVNKDSVTKFGHTQGLEIIQGEKLQSFFGYGFSMEKWIVERDIFRIQANAWHPIHHTVTCRSFSLGKKQNHSVNITLCVQCKHLLCTNNNNNYHHAMQLITW